MKYNFIPTDLHTKASEQLEEEVRNEMDKKDPPSAKEAHKAIAKNLETTSKDRQKQQSYGSRFRRW